MKILLMTDIEGVAGVNTIEMAMTSGQEQYELGRIELMKDTNAAIDGLYAGGADTVYVYDGHAKGENFIKEMLHPKAIQVYSHNWHELIISGEIDGYAEVGLHAMAGIQNAFLDHTQSSKTIFDYKINGISCGEFIQGAAYVGRMSSKFINGFIYDRIGMKKTMNICYACAFIALICVTLIANTTTGKVFASVRIIFASIALPLETVMLPIFANELFGNKSFNKVVGMFSAATTAGFALASPFSQLWKMLFGDYTVSMLVFAIFIIFVTVSMQFIVMAAHRDRKAILQSLAEAEEIESPAEAQPQ